MSLTDQLTHQLGTPPIERLAYSVTEGADLIGMSRRQLYRLIGTGVIEARKSGTRTLVMRDELERYLASLPPWEPMR